LTIYVNPENPADSVVDPGLTPLFALGLLPLLFIFIGIALFVYQARVRAHYQEQLRKRIVRLKSPSPVARAVGAICFAVIWGGVVFLLLKSDAPSLLSLIFAAIELPIIGGAVYSVLSLWNPRIEAEITPGAIFPGTGVSLRWRMQGKVERIESFEIVLRCIKITTETRYIFLK